MFVPDDPALAENPYPVYARLRREVPVMHLPGLDMWVVSRYQDVVRILRDPATFSSAIGMSPDFAAALTMPGLTSAACALRHGTVLGRTRKVRMGVWGKPRCATRRCLTGRG